MEKQEELIIVDDEEDSKSHSKSQSKKILNRLSELKEKKNFGVFINAKPSIDPNPNFLEGLAQGNTFR